MEIFQISDAALFNITFMFCIADVKELHYTDTASVAIKISQELKRNAFQLLLDNDFNAMAVNSCILNLQIVLKCNELTSFSTSVSGVATNSKDSYHSHQKSFMFNYFPLPCTGIITATECFAFFYLSFFSPLNSDFCPFSSLNGSDFCLITT